MSFEETFNGTCMPPSKKMIKIFTLFFKQVALFRTHDNINTIWVDTGSDTIQIVDKKTLKIVNEVVPSPGKKAMHIEFTKDGKYALVSIWENDGAVVIYDTATLKEVKRLPFMKPVGKYNATNKKY